MTSPFTTKTLSFLRALKRNNRREWFQPRKDEYETHVRAPMVSLLERLSSDLRSFAPELIAEPKISLFRIYRDTRFSSDKRPYKTHVAARFPLRGVPKGEGAGLYFEIAPGWVWMGGGMYMPTTADLHDIRAQIAATHPRGLHKVVTAPAFTRAVGELTGDRLTRVPLGYAKDHPASHYLQFKQFLGSCEYDVSLATSRRFYPELLKVFRAVAPLVQFLNGAIEPRLTQVPLLVSEEPPRNLRQTAALRPVPEPMW
ncbi:MAG TPA: DUF2461 domain-containing protein [Vicinamibacterales bacterium]